MARRSIFSRRALCNIQLQQNRMCGAAWIVQNLTRHAAWFALTLSGTCLVHVLRFSMTLRARTSLQVPGRTRRVPVQCRSSTPLGVGLGVADPCNVGCLNCRYAGVISLLIGGIPAYVCLRLDIIKQLAARPSAWYRPALPLSYGTAVLS